MPTYTAGSAGQDGNPFGGSELANHHWAIALRVARTYQAYDSGMDDSAVILMGVLHALIAIRAELEEHS